MSLQQVTADVTPVLPVFNIMYMRWSITFDFKTFHLYIYGPFNDAFGIPVGRP